MSQIDALITGPATSVFTDVIVLTVVVVGFGLAKRWFKRIG